MTQVAWIFSLARCGSSIIAYAAAAPWRIPVADEPFGPWDRTGPPYNYPPEQKQLKELFWNVGEHLTPEVLALANTVFDTIAGPAGRVVSKHPHDMIKPDEFDREFPHHKHIFLLRNPLRRLNSLYARKWLGAIGPNHDLDRFKLVGSRWAQSPHRMTYEEFRADPRAFFARVWRAWDWPFTDADLDKALAYQAQHYHDNSARLSDRNPDKVLSDQRWAVPEEAVQAYLSDPHILELMRLGNWPTDRAAYPPAA